MKRKHTDTHCGIPKRVHTISQVETPLLPILAQKDSLLSGI